MLNAMYMSTGVSGGVCATIEHYCMFIEWYMGIVEQQCVMHHSPGILAMHVVCFVSMEPIPGIPGVVLLT